jgi:hypothetical protein
VGAPTAFAASAELLAEVSKAVYHCNPLAGITYPAWDSDPDAFKLSDAIIFALGSNELVLGFEGAAEQVKAIVSTVQSFLEAYYNVELLTLVSKVSKNYMQDHITLTTVRGASPANQEPCLAASARACAVTPVPVGLL